MDPSAPTVIPQKRALEDEHAPQVSSPLNPDTGVSRARNVADKAPVVRAPREKKESLKKREANASSVPPQPRGTPDRHSESTANQTVSRPEKSTEIAPLRYKLAPPKAQDYEIPKGPVLTPHHERTLLGQSTQFHEIAEHVYNRKGFRYTLCVADPKFPASNYYRQTEAEPFTARINYEDRSSHILFDEAVTHVTTEKGFRMARANVGAREGRWFWECKITSGIPNVNSGNPRPAPTISASGKKPEPTATGGHVRIGWARREASLEALVGFDAYSYGLRDVGGQKVHMSRPKDFFPPGEEIQEGDVIGLEIELPSLALHRKVVSGEYNPAVDLSDEAAEQGLEGPDIIRDRIPIRYKAQCYFEQFEYHSTKELEELMNPSALQTAVSGVNGTHSTQDPNPTHPLVPLRTLPNSSIKVYKNGRLMGTPFTELLAFLPPASKPQPQVGARDGLDDGMLGYFPAISVFRGGAATANFGPHFWFPPPDMEQEHLDDVDMIGNDDAPTAAPALSRSARSTLRPISERYDEQIAEDVTYDLVDEVDFWLQDGGEERKDGPSRVGVMPPSLMPADAEQRQGSPSMLIDGGAEAAGQIKEIVQEDE